jgi:hypothetical protein
MRYEDAAVALAAATNWHKSSRSQAQNGCVEVGSAKVSLTGWHKSSFSNGENACVEVGGSDTVIGVRDTKLAPVSPILAFPARSWVAFTEEVRQR